MNLSFKNTYIQWRRIYQSNQVSFCLKKNITFLTFWWCSHTHQKGKMSIKNIFGINTRFPNEQTNKSLFNRLINSSPLNILLTLLYILFANFYYKLDTKQIKLYLYVEFFCSYKCSLTILLWSFSRCPGMQW